MNVVVLLHVCWERSANKEQFGLEIEARKLDSSCRGLSTGVGQAVRNTRLSRVVLLCSLSCEASRRGEYSAAIRSER